MNTDEHLIDLLKKLAVIGVIAGFILALYFVMSPYQNCKRNVWDQKPLKNQWYERNIMNGKCSQITDW